MKPHGHFKKGVYNHIYTSLKGGEIITIEYAIPFMVLMEGAYEDYCRGRIQNRLIAWGLWAGLTFRLVADGPPGIITFLFRAAWPVLLLYVLFLLRGLGAGDIKLFMCISPFLGTKAMISVIIFSIIFGAGFSCYRIYKNYSTFEKINHIRFGVCILMGFILTVALEGFYEKYHTCV